jgi:transmembrane sensor
MDSKRTIKEQIVAFLNGDLSVLELQELTRWLSSSDENAKYFARVKDIWETSLVNSSHIAETEQEWSRFLSKISNEVHQNFLRKFNNWQLLLRIAAILIFSMMFGALLMKYFTREEPVFISSVTPPGSISQLILLDSTLIYLNAGSEIIYSAKNKYNKRDIYLNGEAWFHVKKNNEKPVVVRTAGYNVQVTGTQFNIKAYPSENEITTTLEQGEVKITSSENYKLQETIILKPGEQLILNKKSKLLSKKTVDTRLFTAWKDNKLIFLNMNFSELVVLLERRYGVDIDVNDEGILKYHYTGTIKNESILEILEIIKHTLPINYKIEGQKVIIN